MNDAETIATQAAEIARLNEVNERLSKIANARISPLESAVGHTIDQLRETVATVTRERDEAEAKTERIDDLLRIAEQTAAEKLLKARKERDAAITERNDLLAINRGYIADKEQLQSALDAVTRERDAAIADLRTLKEFFDANPNHLANQLRNAIAERDEAREQRKQVQEWLDEANAGNLDLQQQRDSLASQLDAAKRKLDLLPADWLEDSSLETWFPLTAKELTELNARVRELEEKVRDFITARDHHIKDSSSLEHRMALETLRKSL